MINRISFFDFPFYYVEQIDEYKKANNFLLEILKQEKKENPEGRLVSNRGGYQTDHILKHKLFYKFAELIKPHITELKNEIKIKPDFEIAIDGAWINENKKLNFNMPHLHPQCHFAAVYYVNFPKDSGSILFLNPNKSASMTGLTRATDCSHYKCDFEFIPQSGTLLIFPSYFEHYVLQGDNIDTRITCSFNMSIIQNEIMSKL